MWTGTEDGWQDSAICCLQSALVFVYFVKREIGFTYKDNRSKVMNEEKCSIL